MWSSVASIAIIKINAIINTNGIPLPAYNIVANDCIWFKNETDVSGDNPSNSITGLFENTWCNVVELNTE